ncbi:alpha/beta hydrolase [Reichenbachiella versicolor]|uniref:alpha/beta hydrolase n=1 Tax=Reichenbachiella versicolor TaxID=1821036 RepID=UPI000D6E703F|nr:alpha/beta hydrolase [Reichenbachiella versicolor]
MKYILLFMIALISLETQAIEKVTFKSAGGVSVTADLHFSHPKSTPVILMFHQAGWSRGEYLEVAPTFNQLGYNCVAVDLRSGNLVNGVRNQTNADAKRLMKPTSYLDAYPDMVAALDFVKSYCDGAPIIVLGSSYSASLSIRLSSEYSSISALILFSPGEYFSSAGKGRDYIQTLAEKVTVPSLIMSSYDEQENVKLIYAKLSSESKIFFYPIDSPGNHGAKALYTKFYDHKLYWERVMSFLAKS